MVKVMNTIISIYISLAHGNMVRVDGEAEEQSDSYGPGGVSADTWDFINQSL